MSDNDPRLDAVAEAIRKARYSWAEDEETSDNLNQARARAALAVIDAMRGVSHEV